MKEYLAEFTVAGNVEDEDEREDDPLPEVTEVMREEPPIHHRKRDI